MSSRTARPSSTSNATRQAMRSPCRQKRRSSTPSRTRMPARRRSTGSQAPILLTLSRDTLLIQTRFESLDGGVYRLYLLANPSMAGGGANNKAW